MSCGCTSPKIKVTRPAALLYVLRAVDGDFGEVLQAVEGVLRDFLFMLANLFHADARQVIDGDAKADGFGDIRCSRLEFIRQIVVLRVVEPHFLDHFSSAHERRHCFENRPPAIQNSAGRRTAHLMAAEYKKITIDGLDIHRHVRDALRAINENHRALLVGRISDQADRVDRAENVGLLCDRHEFRAIGDEAVEIVKPQRAFIV